MNLAIQKQRIESFQREGFSFDVIDSGPLDGQPFVLLHGFPETNKSWQETAEILNQNGYRTFAVNQRGYSLGAQPQNRRDYRSSYPHLQSLLFAYTAIFGQAVSTRGARQCLCYKTSHH